MKEPIKVRLILSGSYLNQETREYYGKIPPSFIPLNGRRLFDFQSNKEMLNTRTFLTIPKDYSLNARDRLSLQLSKISVIEVPDLPLSKSILFAINQIQALLITNNWELDMVHGDNLVEEIPENSVAITQKPTQYAWGDIRDYPKFKSYIFAGRLRISSTKNFTLILDKNNEIMDVVSELVAKREVDYFIVHKWHDFGNPRTLIESKKSYLKGRSFNLLRFESDSVKKSSSANQDKIQNEAEWFSAIPQELGNFVPKLLSRDSNSYSTEFIEAVNLSEMLVFGRLEMVKWRSILQSLLSYLQLSLECAKMYGNEQRLKAGMCLRELIVSKTMQRIENYSNHLFGSSSKFGKIEKNYLKSFVQNLDSIECDSSLWAYMHGDLVFSNIFWDVQKSSIKLVDPRASNEKGDFALLGDIRYDLGKIYQSVFLHYDIIVAESMLEDLEIDLQRFYQSIFERPMSDYQEIFEKVILNPLGINIKEIRLIALALLIGLIPLHSDSPNRQSMFIERIKQELSACEKSGDER